MSEQVEDPSAFSSNRAIFLRRTIWRWHFWAGLLAAPVLIIASVTGAIYIFEPELEWWLYSDLVRSSGQGSLTSYQQQVAAAEAATGFGWRAEVLNVNNTRPYAHSVMLSNNADEHKVVYVDPYGARVLGEKPPIDFLSIVLKIHRTLFLGTFGRLVMELTTCWAAVLLLTGIWLWWPKSWRHWTGVLVPRLGGKLYTAARDLHAIPGALLMPIGFVIALTGLLYTFVWGQSFIALGFVSGSFDILTDPPQSAAPTRSSTKLTVDQAMQIAVENEMPAARLSLFIPAGPKDAYSVQSGHSIGPSIAAAIFIDQYSGAVLQKSRLGDLPIMAQWTQWNYPLHVGSVLGLTTRLVWLLACAVLCVLPVTGIWMWLSRRRRGTTGFPNRINTPLPAWLWGAIVALGLLLPLAGLSFVLVGAFEWIRMHLKRSPPLPA